MNCYKCSFYRQGLYSNKCTLLKWENCRTSEDCTCVNDDGTINEEELEKMKEYM